MIAPPLSAQAPAKRTPEQNKTSYDAHKGDFDYLLGDWEFSATSQAFGKFKGYWSAVRLGEGPQILDEYRVVGDKDETFYVTTTLRAYNATLDQWELVSTEGGSGLQNIGTAHRVGSEMRIGAEVRRHEPESLGLANSLTGSLSPVVRGVVARAVGDYVPRSFPWVVITTLAQASSAVIET